jgi:hypothetical protein
MVKSWLKFKSGVRTKSRFFLVQLLVMALQILISLNPLPWGFCSTVGKSFKKTRQTLWAWQKNNSNFDYEDQLFIYQVWHLQDSNTEHQNYAAKLWVIFSTAYIKI